MATTIETLELKILANSTSAKIGLDALSSSLKKLKNASSGKLGLGAIANEIDGLDKSLKKVNTSNNKSSGSFTDLFHKVSMGVNTFKRLGSAMWSSIENSSDYTETLNLFSVSMGEYAGQAQAYAEKVSAAMGIDTAEWMEAQGIFMTLATGFGVAGDRANTMSRNLTQLSYDLASFYNMDVDEAFLKLKSGLAGELEPLRAIGYDLSQAKLEATALALGIDKAVSSMTQAEKAELRYYAIMTQVTQTHGDMARTLDDPANQLRVLKAEVNMASREIGNVFIPALNAILPYAIAGAKVIGALARSIASLFGNKEEGQETAIETAGETLASSTASTASNLEDAQKEAKKLKSYMLGIDELNVINPDTESAVDGGSSFEYALPDYQTFDPETGELLADKFLDGLVETKVAAITEEMKKWLGITGELTDWSDLFATKLGKILILVAGIGTTLLLWKIGAGAMLLADKLPTFTQILTSFTTALKGFAVGAIIAAAIAGAAYLISLTDDTMTKIGAIVSAGFLAVGAILAFTGNIPLGIALMAVGALSMVSAITINSSALSDEVKRVITVITGIVSAALLVVGAILAFSGASIPVGIALMLGGALTMATAVVPKWNGLSDTIKGVLTAILALVGATMLVLGIILLCSGMGTGLGIALILAGLGTGVTPVATNWNYLVDVLKNAGNAIVTWWKTDFAQVFTKEWWENLIKNCGEGIKNGLKWLVGLLNKGIDGINYLLSKTYTLPDWLGGGSFTIGWEIPHIPIPTFAEGGFPEQGQMFIAREAGAEMVGTIGRRTAVANNDQIVGGIASGVATANEEQNALLREQNSLLRAILEKDSGVYLDGKNLTNSVEKYQRERGRVLIKGGVR